MSAIVVFGGDPYPHERLLRERLQDEFAAGVAIVGLRFEAGSGLEVVSAMAHRCPGSNREGLLVPPEFLDVRPRVEGMLQELGLTAASSGRPG